MCSLSVTFVFRNLQVFLFVSLPLHSSVHKGVDGFLSNLFYALRLSLLYKERKQTISSESKTSISK